MGSNQDRPKRDLVVLAHGLAASRYVFLSIERHLRQAGYRTLNWGYSSVRGTVASLGGQMAKLLSEIEEDPGVARYHLVCHSMGCILARVALEEFHPQQLGRIVMLGPPHHGSHVATKLAPWLGGFCEPLRELTDADDSFVNRLPELHGFEIGIIAASRDRVVRVGSTRISEMNDHLIVESGHTSMLFRKDVAANVEHFLRQGRFRSHSE